MTNNLCRFVCRTVLLLSFVLPAQSADPIADVAADVEALKQRAAEYTFPKGDAAVGKEQWGLCMACHGLSARGNPEIQAPRLTGLSSGYIQQSLKKFKAGHRGGQAEDTTGVAMRASTLALDEAMIANSAAFIGSLRHRNALSSLEGNAERGGALYKASCLQCHGEKGLGKDELLTPAISTVEDWYIVKQLTRFRSGWRGTHKDDQSGAIMKKYADALPDEQALQDLAVYIIKLNRK